MLLKFNMSVKGNDLFQAPDWINSDGRKTVKVTRSRPNVKNGPNVTTSTTANVRIVSNVKSDRPRPRPSKTMTKSRPRPPSVRDELSEKSNHLRKSASNEHDIPANLFSGSNSSRGRSASESELATDVRLSEQNVKSDRKYRVKNSSYIARKQLSGVKQGIHNHSTNSQSRDPISRNGNARDVKSVIRGDPTCYPETYEEVKSEGILFLNDNMTVRPADFPESCAGRISSNQLMLSSGASSFETVFEVNLHSHALDKIECLSKFTRLRTLDLSCNRISRIENLQHNKELKELTLYDNLISEVNGLERLEDLCHLQVQHNRITKLGNGLKGKKALKILRLDCNRIEAIEAREVASLSALVSLDVSCNRLKDIAFINTLPVLEEFNASHNCLEMVADISRCKRLKEVNVSSNRLRNISGLSRLQSLLVLHIADNLLTSNSLKALSKLQCLQFLDCSGNNLINLAMLPDQFPCLEVLLAARNKLAGIEKLQGLQECTCLTELILEDNPVCSDNESYHHFKQTLVSSLENLDMVDGVHMKKPIGALGHVPIMRPMSATAVLSTRQVENQLKHVEEYLSTCEDDLISSFANLRASMSSLPSTETKTPIDQPPSYLSTHLGMVSVSPRTTTPDNPRSSSRCGSRHRIAEAQAYAATHF